MRHALWFIVLLSLNAFATERGSKPHDHSNSNTSYSSVSVNSSNVSSSVGTATADSTSSAVGGDANASVGDVSQNVTVNASLFGTEGGTGEVGSQSSGSGGSNSLVQINEAKQPDKITLRNVPTTIAPDIYPTVPCFKGGSFSIGFSGFGGSAGGGKIDEDCVKREYIRLAHAMGAPDRALWMWCKQPAVYEDFGDIESCLKFNPIPDQSSEVVCTECEHEGWLMANITEEEYLEQQRRIEDKNAQQQTLIDSLEMSNEELNEQVHRLQMEQQRRLELEEQKTRKLRALLQEETK